MMEYIRSRFYWPGYLHDIDIHLRSCADCLRRENPRRRKAPLQCYNVGNPFQRVCVDIMGPFPTSKNGNKYLVTLLDQFTKWPEVVTVKDIRSETVASALLYNIFNRFGIPSEIHTD